MPDDLLGVFPLPSIKRRIADAIGSALNVTIVPPGAVAPIFEREYLTRFLHEFSVDCVFDVGANEGQYAEVLRAIGYRGPIVSFEPIPDAAHVLRRKSRRDPLWFIEQTALDDQERGMSFNVMRSSQYSSLKAPTTAETSRCVDDNAVVSTVALTTTTLSTHYQTYKARLGFSRPFLKMDTQGNDLAVARGAGSHLREFAGLQSELVVKRIYDGVDDYRTTLDFYLDSGFEISAFVPNNLGHFPVLIDFDCILYNPRISPYVESPAPKSRAASHA